MTLRRCARGLVAACLIVIASAAGGGAAQAEPIPIPPPLPPAIDPLVPLNPGLWVDPSDGGGNPRSVEGNFGRFCENAWVHCQ